MRFRRVHYLTGLFMIWHGLAAADDTAIMDFMGTQGCTVDTAVQARAAQPGIDADAFEVRIAKALNDGDAEKHGAWTLLAETICSIRMPEIETPFPLEDPNVGEFVSAPDAYEHRGCFVDGAKLLDHMITRSGQDKDRANDAYLRFLASGIISGEVRFYTGDPLATPPGFQVFSGNCADVPDLAAIRQNHALLVQQFGNVIRTVGGAAGCDGDITALLQRETASLPGNTNAWMFYEVTIIAMAAGWFEGMSHSDRGVPRPPLCH